jgi:hypothetical protein
MPPLVRSLFVAAVCAAAVTASALSPNDAGDIVRAQILINKVLQVVDKYRQFTVVLEAPAPIQGNSGKYLLPYKADGQLTPWASKTVSVAASKMVGEKVGEKATEALAAKIPFGGLAGGLIKKKSKEVAANAMLGGPEFIKKNSDLSFANLNDYALYLHVQHGKSANFQQALAAAMAVYPELEGTFEGAINQAYRTQAAKAGHRVN